MSSALSLGVGGLKGQGTRDFGVLAPIVAPQLPDGSALLTYSENWRFCQP